MISITQEELEKRLDSKVNVLRGQTTGGHSHTFNDNPNLSKPVVPPEARGLVSALAALQGINNTAADLGLERHQVSNIARGLDRKGKADPTRQAEVKNARESVADYALGKVLSSLSLLTDERLEKLPTKDLAEASKDLSVVVRNISGDAGTQRPNIAQVVLFSPRVREDSEYEAITVEAIAK